MSGFLTATEVLNASILRILASSGVAVNSGFMVETVAGAKLRSHYRVNKEWLTTKIFLWQDKLSTELRFRTLIFCNFHAQNQKMPV